MCLKCVRVAAMPGSHARAVDMSFYLCAGGYIWIRKTPNLLSYRVICFPDIYLVVGDDYSQKRVLHHPLIKSHLRQGLLHPVC